MRTLGFGLILITAGLSVFARAYPNELQPLQEQTQQFVEKACAGVEANPSPVIVAFATFILTVVYHKGRGKTFKEAVGMAAIRTPVLEGQTIAQEAPVVRRARARSTKNQLLVDKKVIEDRHKVLPNDIVKAEKDVAWAQNEATKLEDQLFEKRKLLSAQKAHLSTLLDEQEEGLAELVEIESELKKLSEVA